MEAAAKVGIKNMLNFKKPSRIIIVTALALLVVICVCFAVNRATDMPEEYPYNGDIDESAVYAPNKWLDYYLDGQMPWDGSFELKAPEYPDAVFQWTPYEVRVIDSDGGKTLFGGMPVWSVYLADLNGDGLPELCATASFGSGIVDTRVVVCDYANDRLFDLSDRMLYDYYLSISNNQLVVTQTGYLGSDIRATGSMAIINDELVVFGIDRTRPEIEPKETTPPEEYLSPTEIVRQELLNDGCKIAHIFLMSQSARKSLQGVDTGELAVVYASYTEGEYGDAIYCMRYDFERAATDSPWTHSEPTFWEGIAIDVAAYVARMYLAEQNGVSYDDIVLSWAFQEEAEALFPDIAQSRFAAFYIGVSGDDSTVIILTSPDGQSHWKVIGYDGKALIP